MTSNENIIADGFLDRSTPPGVRRSDVSFGLGRAMPAFESNIAPWSRITMNIMIIRSLFKLYL